MIKFRSGGKNQVETAAAVAGSPNTSASSVSLNQIESMNHLLAGILRIREMVFLHN